VPTQGDPVIKIRDSVAFVTGANRGLGLLIAQEPQRVMREYRVKEEKEE
jgi:hypothetical protein